MAAWDLNFGPRTPGGGRPRHTDDVTLSINRDKNRGPHLRIRISAGWMKRASLKHRDKLVLRINSEERLALIERVADPEPGYSLTPTHKGTNPPGVLAINMTSFPPELRSYFINWLKEPTTPANLTLGSDGIRFSIAAGDQDDENRAARREAVV